MLTEKQLRFANEYLLDPSPNAKQAAIRAGYSKRSAEVTASRLLRNAKVARAIEEARAARSARVVCNADWVLENLRNVTERCLQAKPVFDARGKLVDGVWTFDSRGANTALRSIGDHLSMFKQRHEHSGPSGGPIQYENVTGLSDEELEGELRELETRRRARAAVAPRTRQARRKARRRK